VNKIQLAYKQARKYLGLSLRKAANLAGVSEGAVRGAESNKVNNINWMYTKFLIEQGINPYFLIGESDEIKGQLIHFVSRKKYELLESENENLKAELENLKQKMEETVSRSEFEEVTHKLEAYAEIIRMLKNEKS